MTGRTPSTASDSGRRTHVLALLLLLVGFQVIGTGLHAATVHDVGEDCQICVGLDRLDTADTPTALPGLAARVESAPLPQPIRALNAPVSFDRPIRAPPASRHA